jgi:aspartate/methionine/tyrosine aminotransferase
MLQAMRRIDQIEPFRVMQLLERAKELEAEGRKIIHMEIGEPDFSTPASVIEAAQRHLATGDNFYTPSTGAPELQQALANWYETEYGVDVPSDRILITPGTSGAFSLIYAVLLEAGESVLLSDPGYPCQRNFIRLAGGMPINIPVGPESRYHLSAELIHTCWREETRAAVLINPSNPTGTMIDGAGIKAIAETCRDHGGHLISDEIYHGLTYGAKAHCALEFDSGAIIVNGFSKRWAMTGWRIGWVIVPDALIDACRRVMQNIFIAAPTLSQHAAIAALSADGDVEVMRLAYDQRRSYLLQALPELGFDIVIEPQGAFYIYANVEKLTADSRAFCWNMLEKAGVAITPGEDFGSYRADQHVRFSYATGLDDIREGVARMKKLLQ